MDDREVVAAIAARDPAGIAVAYDRYAPHLYGYCHWMLSQPADVAEAVKNTFVITSATLGDFPEVLKLRPWLYAVATNECLRRLARGRLAADAREADEADRRADAGQPAAAAVRPIDAADEPTQVMQPFRAAPRARRRDQPANRRDSDFPRGPRADRRRRRADPSVAATSARPASARPTRDHASQPDAHSDLPRGPRADQCGRPHDRLSIATLSKRTWRRWFPLSSAS